MYSANKSLFKKNILNLIFGSVLSILCSFLSVLIAFFLKELTEIAIERSLDRFIEFLIKFGIYIVVSILANYLLIIFQNKFIRKGITSYKEYCIKRFLKSNIRILSDNTTGKYISFFTNNITSIQDNYLSGIFNLIGGVSLLIFGLMSMFYLNWILALITIVLSFIPLVLSIVFSKRLSYYETGVSNENEKYVSFVDNILKGFSVIKSFKSEKEILNLFTIRNHQIENSKFVKRNLSGLIELLISTSNTLTVIICFCIGTFFSVKGIIEASVLLAFIQLLNYVLSPIGVINNSIVNLKSGKALIDNFEKSLNNADGNEVLLIKNNNTFELNNLCYSYGEKNILKNISLSIEPNKKYVIVGESGSGKSTLLNILSGQLNDYKGTAKINGVEINKLASSSLYELITIIQQNVFIFDDTIKNNITLWKDFDENKIHKVVEKSSISKLINEKGFNYDCGENGANLSGGEKQRISIARSILKENPVIIMDEATSALDTITSEAVENDILSLKDKTVISVTHKLNTSILKKYDNIFVLKDGEIIESGSYDDLFSRKGYFYSMLVINN